MGVAKPARVGLGENVVCGGILGAFSAAAGPAFCMEPSIPALGPVEKPLWDLHPPNDSRSPQSHQGSWDSWIGSICIGETSSPENQAGLNGGRSTPSCK